MKYNSFLSAMQLDVTALAKPLKQPVAASESAFDTLVGDDVIRDLRGALLSMRADDREPWVRMGIALKTLGDQGRGLWLEWSSTSPKFSLPDAAETWETFRPTQTGYQAVFAEASRNGWRNPAKHSDSQLGFDSLEDTVAEISEVLGEKKSKFTFVTAAEFAKAKPMKWCVSGLIPQADIGAVFGASGSGKTFAVLDVVAHIATGRVWRGHKVVKGKIAYICAEGSGGFRNRILAYSIAHGIPLDELDILILDVPPNMMQTPDALEIAKQLMGKGITLIVFDTFAGVMAGGSENDVSDVTTVMNNCKAIGRAIGGAMSILLHHVGQGDKTRERGSSAIRAALDVSLFVECAEDKIDRQLSVAKFKDADDVVIPLPFVLASVIVGFDDDGVPITSCAVDSGGI